MFHPPTGRRLARRFSLEPEATADATRYPASLSSELAYKRDQFIEILDHSPEAIDLSRASRGLPLLFNHQTDRPVGRAHDVRVENRRLRADLQIANNADGAMVRALLEVGHGEVSVGYVVHEWAESGRQDGIPVYRAIRWQIYEASIVAVPADHTVGLSRSEETIMQDNTPQHLTRSERRAMAAEDKYETTDAKEITGLAKIHGERDPEIRKLADQAIMEGRSMAWFRNSLMQYWADQPKSNLVYNGGMMGGSTFSLSRAIQSIVDPSSGVGGYEREVSQDIQRRSGVRSDGIIVPFGAVFGPLASDLRTRAFSAGGNGSVTVQTSVNGDEFIDVLRARSIVVAMGARTMTGLSDNVNLPRQATPTVAGWLAEVEDAAATDAAMDVVQLRPKRLGAYVDVSRQLVIQSSVDIENWVARDLAETIAQEIDRVALFGTGQNNQPLGVLNTVGISSVVGGADGATLGYEHILKLEQAVADKDAMFSAGTSGYVLNPTTRAWLKRQPKVVAGVVTEPVMSDEAPLSFDGMERLNGYRAGITTKVPSNGTKGTGTGLSTLLFADWSQLIVATFGGGVELIVDPYTLAKSAQIRIICNVWVDVAIRHPESFAVMTDAKLSA